MLRTNLQFSGSGGPETYLVSSAVPGDGKTHVVANLAIVLAESGARVTLVDADMRNPRVADVMGIEGSAGLSDVLIDRVSLNDVLQPWGMHDLSVLPAGQIPPNPSELIGSQVMRNLIRELEETADYVLIDTPPVLPVTDAAVHPPSPRGRYWWSLWNGPNGAKSFKPWSHLKPLTVDSWAVSPTGKHSLAQLDTAAGTEPTTAQGTLIEQ